MIQLLKKQLELTERHLQSQQSLYRSYCSSLEAAHRMGAREQGRELYARVREEGREQAKPAKSSGGVLSYREAVKQVKQEMAEEEAREERERRGRSQVKETSRHSKPRSERVSRRKGKSRSSPVEESVAEEIEYDQDFEEESALVTESNISTDQTSQSSTE